MLTLLRLFYVFTKIGIFTVGGGYAMLPLLQSEIVDKMKWIKEEEFCELLALAQSAPGPISINISVFVGYTIDGMRGSIVAIAGAAFPSFIVILWIAMYFIGYQDNRVVAKAFMGMRPAVVSLITAPVYRLAKKMKLSFVAILYTAVIIVLIVVVKLSPVFIILLSILIGLASTHPYFNKEGSK